MSEPEALEGAQVSPKRKFAKEVTEIPAKDPIVKCRVTVRGADRISTGLHEANLGDERYAEGEIFETELSNALLLRDGDEAWQMRNLATHGFRDWVEIIEPQTPRRQLIERDFQYGAV